VALQHRGSSSDSAAGVGNAALRSELAISISIVMLLSAREDVPRAPKKKPREASSRGLGSVGLNR